MKARRTLFGFVPAKLSTRVMRTRSMAVLLNADAMVKPPMRSMMVGENIWEKMYLRWLSWRASMGKAIRPYFVASDVSKRSVPSEDRMILRVTRRKGTQRDVTKRGIAFVNQSASSLTSK